MKSAFIRKLLLVLIILTPLVTDLGCKKQPKCGCGKDVLREIVDGLALVYYSPTAMSAQFVSVNSSGSSYLFCNPGEWIDTLRTGAQGKQWLISGQVFYECNYLMNSGNSGGYMPPVYQVIVTNLKEDNYGKK
jgi:hypothetical protein